MPKSRFIFIGDVHGCIHELNLLVEKLSLRQSDTLVFIGDLIDKGPDSPAVVKRFCELRAVCNVKLVLGNHEEKFLRYLKHIERGSGTEKEMKGTAEFPNLCKNLVPDEIAALKDAYFSIHFRELSITGIHGGIGNKVGYEFPFDYQYSKHNPKDFKGLELINKTRFLNPHGKFVGLGEEKESDKFWAETYNGRYGKMVFGHQPFIQENPMIFQHAYGIDTGCVFGGWLTAMIIENSNISFESVKALDAYAAKL
jgi:serine/threonine protein phosphatase 1